MGCRYFPVLAEVCVAGVDLIPKANRDSLGELKGTIGDNLPFKGAGAFVSEAPPPDALKQTSRVLLSMIKGFFCSVLNPASIWRMVNRDLFPPFSVFYLGSENRAELNFLLCF